MSRNNLPWTITPGAGAVVAMLILAGGGAVRAESLGKILVPPSGVEKPGDLGRRAHSNVEVFIPATGLPTGGDAAPIPVADWLVETPASLACAYKLVANVAAYGCNPFKVTANPTGGSHAIAIVNPYDYADAHGVSAAANDLTAFDRMFGIAAANLTVIYGTGTPSEGCKNGAKPSPQPGSGWDLEASLGIEWAHAMAPSAKIYLVEANSNNLSDLLNAESVAAACVSAAGGGEVSNSWALSEFSGENANDSTFTEAKVVYFAAAGDFPGNSNLEPFLFTGVAYPAASPNVIGVGGTTFSRNQVTGSYQSQATWNINYSLISILYGTGGGPSAYEPRPAFQAGVEKIVGAARGTPDLTALADINTGVWVYNSTFSNNLASKGVFYQMGGTGAATPITAGIFNELGLSYASSSAALAAIYANTGSVRTKYVTNVSSGLCGPPGYLTSGAFEGGFGSPYDPSWIQATSGIAWNWCGGWGTLTGTK